MKPGRALVALLLCFSARNAYAQSDALRLGEAGYFSTRGLDVLFFNNWYSGLFSDSKLSGIELIHHGVRTATNGDVRLSNTPEQWDPIPRFENRSIDRTRNSAQALLGYPQYSFSYRIEASGAWDSLFIRVLLDKPLPAALVGKAGFNLEFLPSAYFEKTFRADDDAAVFPRTANSAMVRADSSFEAAPLASGRTLVLAPEDAERRIRITSRSGRIALYDGQNKAQNGWFVARELLPADKTGVVLEWVVRPHRIANWTRRPVIAHSQVGYHPKQRKVAVLELDPRSPIGAATLYEVLADGSSVVRLSRSAQRWGNYLRYQYATFDFSTVTRPGVYIIEFAGVRSEPFRIANDVYGPQIWSSTLDTYLPVQMDHVFVNDRYRVWHGVSHLDDARQAPVNHPHFDLYAQGPTTDTRFQSNEHIPGLDVGGWYDAGDFDIRTQSQYALVSGLVFAHETFGIDWDQTTVQQDKRYVDLRHPDGVPDILQQIEHGALWLLSQYRAVGHAINGVVEPTLEQYTHLGDAVTKTDGIANTADDRLAFTSRSSGLDYGSIAALAAASRVLRTRNPAFADSCLATAVRVWQEEHTHPPYTFRSGNTTGGPLEDEELKAAVELLISTNGERMYAARIDALWPYIAAHFDATSVYATRALPFMDAGYRSRLETAVRSYKAAMDVALAKNPFGVPITTGGWGGSSAVLSFAQRNYVLHKTFPEIIGPDYTLRGLEYVLGTHPANSVSLVSGVGTHSKTFAYGNNRADFSFIPGGIVPGIVIVQPDLPELKEDWPFLWYENEYVIPEASLYIFVANAARELLK